MWNYCRLWSDFSKQLPQLHYQTKSTKRTKEIINSRNKCLEHVKQYYYIILDIKKKKNRMNGITLSLENFIETRAFFLGPSMPG